MYSAEGVRLYNRSIAALNTKLSLMDQLVSTPQWQAAVTGLDRGTNLPPWIEMPPGARRFQPRGIIAMAAFVNTVETDLVVYDVPIGWDGVVVTLVADFFGTPALTPGSGAIIWRLKVGLAYAKDYGDIETDIGDLNTPYAIEGSGIRIYSGQRVVLTATVANNVVPDPNGVVIGAIAGWVYPKIQG